MQVWKTWKHGGEKTNPKRLSFLDRLGKVRVQTQFHMSKKVWSGASKGNLSRHGKHGRKLNFLDRVGEKSCFLKLVLYLASILYGKMRKGSSPTVLVFIGQK